MGSSTIELLERRWSAVSHSTAFRRSRKRSSSNIIGSQKTSSLTNLLPSKAFNTEDVKEDSVVECDYMKVSKTEYEEIKNRVLEIERRISIELDNAQVNVEDAESSADATNNDVENVQSEYEKTLTHVGHLSNTTDQLAKQLSKDLKIRKHSDQKVFRSPSARKIGSLRRQSRELQKQNSKLTRNQSWHVTSSTTVIPRVSLHRNVPNSSYSPLSDIAAPTLRSAERKSRRTSRASSFQGTPTFAAQHNVPNSQLYCNVAEKKPWVSGENFFSYTDVSRDRKKLDDSRASLAKLRTQNAGMVLAKAKLFDGFSETEDMCSISSSSLVKADAYHSFDKLKNDENKARYVHLDNKVVFKQNSSPRKRKLKNASISGKENDENYCRTATTVNVNCTFQNNILKNCNRLESPNVAEKHFAGNNFNGAIRRNNNKSPKHQHQTPKQIRPCVSIRTVIKN